MIHSTQEVFSHSTSCITHEVLTELCTHSPFPLAVSSWQPAQARMNKLFRPFSASFFLFSRFLSLRALALLPRPRGYIDGTGVLERRQTASAVATASVGAKLGLPAGSRWWSWMSTRCPQLHSSALQWALCLDSLTDLNLNTPRTRGISAPRIHHPANIYILSLLVCFAKLPWFVSLHPSQLGISFLTFPSVSLASLFLPQSPFNSALSHSLMSLSLSLPPSPFEI